MDERMKESGWRRISRIRVQTLDDKGHTGIGGICAKKNLQLRRRNIISLNWGIQMGNRWIYNHLDADVGKERARKIKKTGFKKILFNIKLDGNVVKIKLGKVPGQAA